MKMNNIFSFLFPHRYPFLFLYFEDPNSFLFFKLSATSSSSLLSLSFSVLNSNGSLLILIRRRRSSICSSSHGSDFLKFVDDFIKNRFDIESGFRRGLEICLGADVSRKFARLFLGDFSLSSFFSHVDCCCFVGLRLKDFFFCFCLCFFLLLAPTRIMKHFSSGEEVFNFSIHDSQCWKVCSRLTSEGEKKFFFVWFFFFFCFSFCANQKQ